MVKDSYEICLGWHLIDVPWCRGTSLAPAVLATAIQGRNPLGCIAAPVLHMSTSPLPMEIGVQEKAEREAGPSPSVHSGCNQSVVFRWRLWCLQGGIFSEDRLLVAPYRGCISLRCCAHLSLQVGLSLYHTDDKVRFSVILEYEE